ncbi:MAG TPA: hypothetical protein VES62_05380 [Thermoleophilaceae bacterium]|nr:hypothetical protein [Thermoleophilaceae bacterium]
MADKLLRIYLQDHLAGSTGGVELARRASGGAEGTTYGDALAKLADEIEADRRALESIMDKFGFGADRAKNLAFWAAEKAGRLKPNGQLTGASPLSRLVELEGLIAGINGKLSLWRSLLEIAPGEPRLVEEGLRHLLERGHEQLGIVEGLRDRAAREALVP